MTTKSIVGVLAALALGGCASIIKGGGPEAFSIRTEPQGANVTVTDLSTGVVVGTGTTPYMVMLKKSHGFFKGAKYKIDLQLPGYAPVVSQIDTTVSGWYVAGNIVFGGLIGWLIVDPATGAMWTLPKDAMDVSLAPAPAPTPTPEKLPASTPTSSVEGAYIGVAELASVPASARTRLVRVN
jgi:hypothetical protein